MLGNPYQYKQSKRKLQLLKITLAILIELVLLAHRLCTAYVLVIVKKACKVICIEKIFCICYSNRLIRIIVYL